MRRAVGPLAAMGLEHSRPITAPVTPPPSGGDVTAPVFTGAPAVVSVTSTSALITWVTNESSSTRVDYATNPTLTGAVNSFDPTLVTSHSRTLTGLASATIYYFRARSADATGNEAISQTQSFSTPSTGGGGGGNQSVQAFTNDGPYLGNTGPRGTLTNTPGGALQPGLYIGKRFTAGVSFASQTGTYVFIDCEFAFGIATVFGYVTRTVTMYHCKNGGLAFEYGGHRNWTLIGCFFGDVVGVPVGSGNSQALRPKKQLNTDSDFDMAAATPLLAEDCYFRIVGGSNLTAHEESVKCDAGAGPWNWRRCTFDTFAPYRGTQTATLNFAGANALFEDCIFRQKNCAVYMIYAQGVNVVFRRCRISSGTGSYYYRGTQGYPYATFENCTDFDTGAAITP